MKHDQNCGIWRNDADANPLPCDCGSESVAIGTDALGIAPESTAGKLLAGAEQKRAKANRLTAGQRYKLASWMLTQDARNLEKMDAWGLGVAASHQLGFTVTGTNAEFVRREVLGIRKPAKAQPAVQQTLCPCVDTIAEFRTRLDALDRENGTLRAGVRTLAAFLVLTTGSNGEVRAIAERPL